MDIASMAPQSPLFPFELRDDAPDAFYREVISPRQGLSAVAGEVIGAAPPIALGQFPAGSRGIL